MFLKNKNRVEIRFVSLVVEEFNPLPRLDQILSSHGNGLDVGGTGFGGGSVFGGNISPRRDAGSAVSFASVAARTRALRPVDETAGTVASVRMRWSCACICTLETMTCERSRRQKWVPSVMRSTRACRCWPAAFSCLSLTGVTNARKDMSSSQCLPQS